MPTSPPPKAMLDMVVVLNRGHRPGHSTALSTQSKDAPNQIKIPERSVLQYFREGKRSVFVSVCSKVDYISAMFTLFFPQKRVDLAVCFKINQMLSLHQFTAMPGGPLENQSSSKKCVFSQCIFEEILLSKTVSSVIHRQERQNHQANQHTPLEPFYFSFIQQRNLL